MLLRVDPAVHDALIRWADDEFRSVNAQVEMLLRRALTDAGRMPSRPDPSESAAGHAPATPERPPPWKPSVHGVKGTSSGGPEPAADSMPR